MTALVFPVILCPVSFSYASIVFASAALSGLFLGFSGLFLIFPGDFLGFFRSLFWAFQVMSCFSASYCIFILLFCAAGMNFFWPDSSPACSFLPQGLFRPPRFIPSLLFFSTRMISFSRIHPQLAFFFHRDYLDRPFSSPACSFLPQG